MIKLFLDFTKVNWITHNGAMLRAQLFGFQICLADWRQQADLIPFMENGCYGRVLLVDEQAIEPVRP